MTCFNANSVQVCACMNLWNREFRIAQLSHSWKTSSTVLPTVTTAAQGGRNCSCLPADFRLVSSTTRQSPPVARARWFARFGDQAVSLLTILAPAAPVIDTPPLLGYRERDLVFPLKKPISRRVNRRRSILEEGGDSPYKGNIYPFEWILGRKGIGDEYVCSDFWPRDRAGSSMEKKEDQDAGRTIATQREVPQLKLGSFVLVAEFDDGGEFYREKARNEIRETPEVVRQALEEIRELLKGEPDLIVPDDDEFLQKFLRPCKWYAKSTFELMKRFYQFRVKNPRYAGNILPSNEKNALESGLVVPMPDRTQDNCRLLVIHTGKQWNPKLVSLDEIYRTVVLSLDAAMAEPKTQIAGVQVILNMDGLSMHHVMQFTPSIAYLITEWVQKCLPCRLKAIHVVNQPYIFNMLFAIFKPFLMEKLRKRIHFHGKDRNSLIAYTGTKCLPSEFGGELIMPDEPIGPEIYKYFHFFEKDFEESKKHGYVGKTN